MTVTLKRECINCGTEFMPEDANDGECHEISVVVEVIAQLVKDYSNTVCPKCGSNLCLTSVTPDKVPEVCES